MAASYFLKVPGVTGGSTASGHQGEIDLLSWSWGAVTTTDGNGGDGTRPARKPTSLNVTKLADDASPKLFAACASGLRYGQMVMTAEYGTSTMTFEMADVSVTAVSSGGHGGEDNRPMESITLDFDHVTTNAP